MASSPVRQKLDEAFAYLLPGVGDDRGEDGAARGCRDDAGDVLASSLGMVALRLG